MLNYIFDWKLHHQFYFLNFTILIYNNIFLLKTYSIKNNELILYLVIDNKYNIKKMDIKNISASESDKTEHK